VFSRLLSGYLDKFASASPGPAFSWQVRRTGSAWTWRSCEGSIRGAPWGALTLYYGTGC